jgi:hypothetical protein
VQALSSIRNPRTRHAELTGINITCVVVVVVVIVVVVVVVIIIIIIIIIIYSMVQDII